MRSVSGSILTLVLASCAAETTPPAPPTSSPTPSPSPSGSPSPSPVETPPPSPELPTFVVTSTPGASTTEAGGVATFTVALSHRPASGVTVALASSDTAEGTVSPPIVRITGESWDRPQTITVTGVDDAVRDGDVAFEIRGEVSSLDPAYAALAFAPVVFTNRDDDLPQVLFDRAPVVTRENGPAITVGVSLDRAPTAPVTVPLAVAGAEATASPASLTFTPADWSTPQPLAITGADDALSDGAQSFVVETGPAVSTDLGWSGVDGRDLWGVNLDDEPVVPELTRVSVDGRGTPGDGAAGQVGVSWDARFVVFASLAQNLAGDDRNGVMDVFVRDVEKGITLPVSVDAAGAVGTAASMGPRISGDGRWVVFHSSAALTPTPTGDWEQVYLRDLEQQTTTLITRLPGGAAFSDSVVDPALDYDGDVIAFSTNVFRAPGSPRQWDVHVLDRRTGEFSPGALTHDGRVPNQGSRWPRLSADGRLIAFVSAASDIVPGDTNGVDDVFLRDRVTGAVERISAPGPGGNDAGRVWLPPALSADGSVVAFVTFATLLPEDVYAVADVYVRDRARDTLEVIQLFTASPPASIDLSADGRVVLIASSGDAIDLDHPQGVNGATYPVLFDRQERVPRRLLNSSAGVLGVAMSGDGRYLALASEDPTFPPAAAGMSHVYLTPFR